MLLNKTSRRQVDPVVPKLFSAFPTAHAMAAAPPAALEALLRPLGIHRKRAVSLARMSREFLAGDFEHAGELHGIGKYGDDAYEIFVRGAWSAVEPADAALRLYHRWLRDHVASCGGGEVLRHPTTRTTRPAPLCGG